MPATTTALHSGAKGKICLVDWFIGIMSSPDNSSYGKLGHIATNCVAGGGVGELLVPEHSFIVSSHQSRATGPPRKEPEKAHGVCIVLQQCACVTLGVAPCAPCVT